MAKSKMTLQAKKKQRAKVHGFRQRMSTANGRKVLSRRRSKGRAKIAVWFFLTCAVQNYYEELIKENKRV